MYQAVKTSVTFPALLFWLLVILLIVMWWKRAVKKRWLIFLTIIVVLFYASSARIVARCFIGSLEWAYPRQEAMPDHADVIIVLGGGCRYYGPDSKPSYVLYDSSVYRIIHAAQIYHRVGGCPIIASGYDALSKDPPDAPLVGDRFELNPFSQLLLQLGVDRDDIILEEESSTTYENACQSKKLIEERGYKDIVLVTDASHMYRAKLCFEKVGLRVTPAGCHYLAQAVEWSARTLLPSSNGVEQSRRAMNEYIGLFWYWLRGRI